MDLRRRRALITNTISIPEVGDIVCVIGGKKKYIKAADITAEQKADAVGVVYHIDAANRKAYIVGKDNSTPNQWSCLADYEITSIPSASGNYEVKLNNVVQGNFAYVRTLGTKEEFATQLEAQLAAWATANPSSKAAKWEARYDAESGKAYLQQWKYDEYENTVTIASTGLSKLIGIEVNANSTIRNSVAANIYSGMCRDRLYYYCVANTTANCNPTTRMNGTTQLFVTFPCSKIYYDGELGDGLRENYATYDAYLDACMIDLDGRQGCLQAIYDGKLQTAALSSKMVTKSVNTRGNIQTIKAYTAANYAINYNSGKAGFGQGDWWLPSMWELGWLMKDLKQDYSDTINVALAAAFGTSHRINVQSYRWSSCRYSTSSAWTYGNLGFSSSNYFYYSLACSCVSAFDF